MRCSLKAAIARPERKEEKRKRYFDTDCHTVNALFIEMFVKIPAPIGRSQGDDVVTAAEPFVELRRVLKTRLLNRIF